MGKLFFGTIAVVLGLFVGCLIVMWLTTVIVGQSTSGPAPELGVEMTQNLDVG